MADTDPDWKVKSEVTERVTREEMMADFEDRGVDERFLRLLCHAPPIKWGLFHHLNTSTYIRDRVALVGDSAHASLPFQAAGASQALEDAFVLGNLFAEVIKVSEPTSINVKAALEAYDRVRRERAQKQLEQSAEVADMIFFQHTGAGSDMSKILPMLQKGRLDWLWYHDIEEDAREAVRIMNELVIAGSIG